MDALMLYKIGVNLKDPTTDLTMEQIFLAFVGGIKSSGVVMTQIVMRIVRVCTHMRYQVPTLSKRSVTARLWALKGHLSSLNFDYCLSLTYMYALVDL